ncbi:MAG: DUF2786 domain-containing protein [Gammaproteobacteria bacterium]|nr:DUF2786 domain-containing protein [Gammaproteobacteria bacterium]
MNEHILEKIKKCLKLAKSANENEAAIALKQAKALMDKYGVDENTLVFSDISEEKTYTKTQSMPPQWNAGLMNVCASAFDCEVFVSKELFNNTSVTFVGVKHSAYLASYAYEVLLRQLTKARKDYYAKNNKRCKRSTRIYRADQFAEGYVSRLYNKINDFAGNTPEIVSQYMSEKHGKLSKIKPRKNKAATDGRSQRGNENAFDDGWRAGKNANLHRPIGGQEQRRLN